jgi:hypothetical protein
MVTNEYYINESPCVHVTTHADTHTTKVLTNRVAPPAQYISVIEADSRVIKMHQYFINGFGTSGKPHLTTSITFGKRNVPNSPLFLLLTS